VETNLFYEMPKAKNGFDCGVYTCIMAYKIFVGMPLTFDQCHVDWVADCFVHNSYKPILVKKKDM
jgi:Ulp1 family protease